MEGPAVGRTEAVPVIERVHTLLLLTDSDLVDLPFALEADKDSEEDSGRGSENEGIGHENTSSRDENKGNGDENDGRGNTDKESRSEDGDAMVE
jgi:hypothetical protein